MEVFKKVAFRMTTIGLKAGQLYKKGAQELMEGGGGTAQANCGAMETLAVMELKRKQGMVSLLACLARGNIVLEYVYCTYLVHRPRTSVLGVHTLHQLVMMGL